jgi:hypothetical protein
MKRLSRDQHTIIATSIVALTAVSPPAGALAAVGWGVHELCNWWTTEDVPKGGAENISEQTQA